MSLPRPRGFSLLEVVVALAIMALSLGVLYRAVGGSARAVGDSTRYVHAAMLAESVLETRQAVPAGGWSESGEWAGLSWSVASAPYDVAGGGVTVHRVQVDVVWSDGLRERRFSLVGLRPQQADDVRAGIPR